MSTTRKIAGAGTALLALALGGCWGGDGSDTPPAAPATSVPDSAAASGTAFVAYIVTLSGSDETSEPLTISSSFAVPADDTSEPTPLT